MSSQDLYKVALNKAMRLCSGRELCIRDIREKADSWGVSNTDAEKLVSVLLREKFIDEDRYAAAYARDKFRYNHWGKIKISAGLKMKGIPADVVKKSLDQIDPVEYRETLEKIISAQSRRIRAKSDYERKAKLMRFGLSRGFESWLLYEVTGSDSG